MASWRSREKLKDMGHERRDVVGRRRGLGVEPKVCVYLPTNQVLDQGTWRHGVVDRDENGRVVMFRRVSRDNDRRLKGREGLRLQLR